VAGTYASRTRAKELLGWEPQYSIAEGIRHSLEWASVRDQVLQT
jgi:UDP-glucose 4-epimerase